MREYPRGIVTGRAGDEFHFAFDIFSERAASTVVFAPATLTFTEPATVPAGVDAE